MQRMPLPCEKAQEDRQNTSTTITPFGLWGDDLDSYGSGVNLNGILRRSTSWTCGRFRTGRAGCGRLWRERGGVCGVVRVARCAWVVLGYGVPVPLRRPAVFQPGRSRAVRAGRIPPG